MPGPKGKKPFEGIANTLLLRIESKIKEIVFDIHANLVDPQEGTPRDTGWAANNWVPQIKSEYAGTAGSPGKVDSSAAENGLNKVATWKSGQGPINITNNVPYIGRLNAGSSKQAPAGFVERAVQKAVNSSRRK